MTPRVHLVVRHAQRVVPLAAGETVTAGRSDECALQLDDPSVSRRHCLFVLAEGGLRVTDLGSANGTFVNDRPVHEAAVAVATSSASAPPSSTCASRQAMRTPSTKTSTWTTRRRTR